MSLKQKLQEKKYVETEYENEKVFIKLLSVAGFKQMASMAETDQEDSGIKTLVSNCLYDDKKEPVFTELELDDLPQLVLTDLTEFIVGVQTGASDKKKANKKKG